MKVVVVVGLLLRLTVSLQSLSFATGSKNDKLSLGQAQIEWLRSRGGFFHSDKIELQPIFKDDDPENNSPVGVFATADLQEDETLAIIPQHCLLKSLGGSGETCDTVRNLMKQRELGDKSEFAPYVDYIFDNGNHKGHLPASWSEAGKELIHTVIGRELPPFHITDISFEEDCGGGDGSTTPDEEEVYLLVLRRSWDDKMLPIYDMFNHRNGKWKNVDSNSAHEGRDIRVFTTRSVKAGEQLYNSYNECADCTSFSHTYALPEMVRDFGFVEEYPRRFVFPYVC